MLMRIKDGVLIIGAVAGLIAGMGKLFVLANAVESNASRIAIIEPKVATHETKIAVADERWDQIQAQIQNINRKLDRMAR